MAEPEKPEPGSNAPSNFFFQENLESVPDPISEILKSYSGIPRDQQISHILKIRNGAYKVHPYPCLGRFRFLKLDLSSHPLYQTYLLPRLLKAGQEQDQKLIFLDLGCCLAQDVRKLMFDGVDAKHLYGCDLQPDFIDAGYGLFRDEQKLPRDHFISPGDIFDYSDSNKLNSLNGQVDILHITAVFHLFNREQQDDVALRCLRLINKTEGANCLVLGAQVGNVNASEFVRSNGTSRFRHNENSWRSLWESACEQEEFKSKVKKLKVEVQMKQRPTYQNSEQAEQMGTPEEGFRWMIFSVWLEF